MGIALFILAPLLAVAYVLIAGWLFMLAIGIMHNDFTPFVIPALSYWESVGLLAFLAFTFWLVNPTVKTGN